MTVVACDWREKLGDGEEAHASRLLEPRWQSTVTGPMIPRSPSVVFDTGAMYLGSRTSAMMPAAVPTAFAAAAAVLGVEEEGEEEEEGVVVGSAEDGEAGRFFAAPAAAEESSLEGADADRDDEELVESSTAPFASSVVAAVGNFVSFLPPSSPSSDFVSSLSVGLSEAFALVRTSLLSAASAGRAVDAPLSELEVEVDKDDDDDDG